MSLLKEKLDAISDEFQSTFTLVSDDTIANLLEPDEKDEVREIIQRHLGDVEVTFKVETNFGFKTLYLITVKERANE